MLVEKTVLVWFAAIVIFSLFRYDFGTVIWNLFVAFVQMFIPLFVFGLVVAILQTTFYESQFLINLTGSKAVYVIRNIFFLAWMFRFYMMLRLYEEKS